MKAGNRCRSCHGKRAFVEEESPVHLHVCLLSGPSAVETPGSQSAILPALRLAVPQIWRVRFCLRAAATGFMGAGVLRVLRLKLL